MSQTAVEIILSPEIPSENGREVRDAACVMDSVTNVEITITPEVSCRSWWTARQVIADKWLLWTDEVVTAHLRVFRDLTSRVFQAFEQELSEFRVLTLDTSETLPLSRRVEQNERQTWLASFMVEGVGTCVRSLFGRVPTPSLGSSTIDAEAVCDEHRRRHLQDARYLDALRMVCRLDAESRLSVGTWMADPNNLTDSAHSNCLANMILLANYRLKEDQRRQEELMETIGNATEGGHIEDKRQIVTTNSNLLAESDEIAEGAREEHDAMFSFYLHASSLRGQLACA